MLCLSGFELYSRWVPLTFINASFTPKLKYVKKLFVETCRFEDEDDKEDKI